MVWGYGPGYTGCSALPEVWMSACRNNDLNNVTMKLDLHGLHVHEAIARLDKTINDWRNTPESLRMGVPQQCPCRAVWLMPGSEPVLRSGHLQIVRALSE